MPTEVGPTKVQLPKQYNDHTKKELLPTDFAVAYVDVPQTTTQFKCKTEGTCDGKVTEWHQLILPVTRMAPFEVKSVRGVYVCTQCGEMKMSTLKK